MTPSEDTPEVFLRRVHPFDALDAKDFAQLGRTLTTTSLQDGQSLVALNAPTRGLHVLQAGRLDVLDRNGHLLSVLEPGDIAGARDLFANAASSVHIAARGPCTVLTLPAGAVKSLLDISPAVEQFFAPREKQALHQDLSTMRVDALMSRNPLTCSPKTSAQDAAHAMAEQHVSSICVQSEGALHGIVTTRDLATRLVAHARPASTLVCDIMTKSPISLPPSALGSDVLHSMIEHGVGHIPICEGSALTGIVTQTDLTRFQATTTAELVGEISEANTAEDMAQATARIPHLLLHLVGNGCRHDVATRLITDLADAATRRLLHLAQARLGPPPVPYLWLACGSQGRQEQTGVSDQDNCLILDDAVEPDQMAWFADLARFVCDGLNTCGYVYCPGDMMATNPRWCQSQKVWRAYFQGWIARPSPEAQMLASVMFDLRPIGGTRSLFEPLQAETLRAAARNSIFVAHMASNALTHTPPLGLWRGFATIRSGEHRNTVDLKHNGVVPFVDLGRIYALQGTIGTVNTRARLRHAHSDGVISNSGGQALIDAYDLIAQVRLEHQARQIRVGTAPDNFLPPSTLSAFERNHLRDAFVVVKEMQSALGHGKGVLG